MKTRSTFDRVKNILVERDQGKKRKLSKKDREAIAEIADRPRMLVRSLPPANQVELSPYLTSLMQLGGLKNGNENPGAFNAKHIARSV